MRRLALVVIAALAAAAAARATPPPLAQVDVSEAPGAQAEAALAVDPENDQVLLAGSNSIGEPGSSPLLSFSRVYSSVDGGATWTSAIGPPAVQGAGKRRCSFGDPTVAIGRHSRQYYGFLSGPCTPFLAEEDLRNERISLEVASRDGPGETWRTAAVFPVRSWRLDDKPAIAVDTSPTSPHVDRVYAAWSKSTLPGRRRQHVAPTTRIVLSWSDDGGSTWSRPAPISDGGSGAVFAALAVDRSGVVFVGWTDRVRRIMLARSVDGGATFTAPLRVETAVGLPTGDCATSGAAIPAQARRCVTPTPSVVVDDRPGVPERVYVTYGAPGGSGREQDVFVSSFDGALGTPSGRRQVNPPDGPVASDQFMPAAAFDRSTGRLWVCYYDTSGDPARLSAFYTCTASGDGGQTWAQPVRAASVASNMSVRAASFFQYGDYEAVAASDGVAHPIWTDSRNLAALRAEVYTTVLTDAQLQPAQ